jgi:hypothetical protein
MKATAEAGVELICARGRQGGATFSAMSVLNHALALVLVYVLVAREDVTDRLARWIRGEGVVMGD